MEIHAAEQICLWLSFQDGIGLEAAKCAST